jgi:hypothetical protein
LKSGLPTPSPTRLSLAEFDPVIVAIPYVPLPQWRDLALVFVQFQALLRSSMA